MTGINRQNGTVARAFEGSRRSFFKAGAAAAGCAALAANAGWVAADESQDTWEDEADVVVIGSGTGLGAARAAAEAGKTVIVLEKEATTGGDWGINGGVVYAGATKVMEELGAVDTRTGEADTLEATYADWMTDCGNRPDPGVVRTVVERAPEMIDYFTSLGVEFTLYQSGPDPITRGHQTTTHSGRAITDAICADLEAKGVKILTSVRAEHILFDSQTGAVCGVEAVIDGARRARFGAKAVVVATGGAARNDELVARYNSEASEFGTASGPWATGDGILMLLETRAAFTGFGKVVRSGSTNCLISAYGLPLQWDTMPMYNKKGEHSFIYVNRQGVRELNEQAGDEGSTYLAQPTDFSLPEYGIFDQAEFSNPEFTCFLDVSHDALDSFVDTGYIKKADTLEELAAMLGISGTGLVSSVEDYNAGLDAGEDSMGRPIELSRKIGEGPYYGYEATVSGKGVNMSAKITAKTESVDLDGTVIPGLYVAGSKLIDHYTLSGSYPGSGSYVTSGFVMSEIAGEAAAAYVG